MRDWRGATPIRYPDADIKSLDPRFDRYRLGHTPIQRLATGMLWAEGPCWFGDEVCANIEFGGRKRNRLFMAASQSIYTVYVETQGAHVA